MNDAVNTATVHYCTNLNRAREKMAKLQKRAAKLGVAPPDFVVVGSHVERQWERQTPPFGEIEMGWARDPMEYGRPTGRVRTVHHCQLTGVGVVKLAGWTFLAALDHELGTENTIVHVAPDSGVELPIEYRIRGSVCDHCQQKRSRKQTYVVRYDNGALKQVGSTCINDFLGMDAAKALYSMEISSLASEMLESDDWGMGGGATALDLTTYLAHVCMIIRTSGWVSRKDSDATNQASTADLAYVAMTKR